MKRITILIAASVAALALAAPASAASPALHEPAAAGHEDVITAANHDLGLNNRGHVDRHAFGAGAMTSSDTAAQAAGHRASAPPI